MAQAPNSPLNALREVEAVLLTVKQVATMVGLGIRTIWRMAASGKFPRPDVKLGSRIARWHRDTVNNWINEQSGRGE